MNHKLTADQVRSEVLRFWRAFSEYDIKTIRSMYGGDAAVFHPSSKRYELGPLTVARYEREYAHPDCKIRFHLGEINVMLLGDSQAAVASYSFELHILNVTTAAGLIDRHVEHGRATHVFSCSADGKLTIVHDHRSAAAKPGTTAIQPPAETEQPGLVHYQ